MPSNCALSRSWTSVMPPRALISLRPWVPLFPVPERTMPIARSWQSSAKVSKKTSIGWRWPRGSAGTERRSAPSRIVNARSGTIAWTRLGSAAMPSAASTTGMAVWRPSRCAKALSRVGSKCRMITKAHPLSAGIASRKRLAASSPPADAPMPTTGITACSGSRGLSGAARPSCPSHDACGSAQPLPSVQPSGLPSGGR